MKSHPHVVLQTFVALSLLCATGLTNPSNDYVLKRYGRVKRDHLETIPVNDDLLLRHEFNMSAEDAFRRAEIYAFVPEGEQENRLRIKGSTVVIDDVLEEQGPYSSKEKPDPHRETHLQEILRIRDTADNLIREIHNEENGEDEKFQRAGQELFRKAEMHFRKKRESPPTGDESDTRAVPYRACIYIDMPGHPEPLFPEVAVKTTCAEPPKVNVQSNLENPEIETRPVEPKEDASPSPHLTSQEMVQRLVQQEDSDIDNIYWLHIPPENPIDMKETVTNLYDTVDRMHQEGKDVLFIPIAKAEVGDEELKHDFLAPLAVTPERLSKQVRKLKLTKAKA